MIAPLKFTRSRIYGHHAPLKSAAGVSRISGGGPFRGRNRHVELFLVQFWGACDGGIRVIAHRRAPDQRAVQRVYRMNGRTEITHIKHRGRSARYVTQRQTTSDLGTSRISPVGTTCLEIEGINVARLGADKDHAIVNQRLRASAERPGISKDPFQGKLAHIIASESNRIGRGVTLIPGIAAPTFHG